MPRPEDTSTSKRRTLREKGTLNPHPDRVSDPLFREEFFDPADLVQVKYEMLRRVRVEKQSVSQAAGAFGFSRPTFYQAQEDFENRGLFGLVPEKRGPTQGHKLTPEVIALVEELLGKTPSLRPPDLAEAIEQRFGISVHPRSIERKLAQKKRR